MSSVSSDVEVSEFETQFIPQENDDELLWEVIEITAERGKKYRVKWAGINPKTKKAWPQQWVAKHDCTEDIVMAWKLKQAKRKRAKEKDYEKVKERQKLKKAGKRSVEVEVVRHASSRGGKQTISRTERGQRFSSVDDGDEWEAGADAKNKGKGKDRVTDESNNEEEGEDGGEGEEVGKDEEGGEEDTPTLPAVVKIGPPRGTRKLSRKSSTITSTSNKKTSSSKDTASIASKQNSPSGKTSSFVLGKRKSRLKEGVQSDPASEGEISRKPSKRRFVPGPQHSSNTIGRHEVVEILDSSYTSNPILSLATQARLAAFDATQLSIKDDPTMLSPERADDPSDLTENMQDDDNFVESVPLVVPLPGEHFHNVVPDIGMAPKHRSNEITTRPPSGNNSYRTGIVPETETESSTNNTQSQPERHPRSPIPPPRLPRPTAIPITPLFLPESPETPPRTPIKSRMKPRTQGSSDLFPLPKINAIPDVDVNVKQKPLQRVPLISPSIFHPHLPSSNSSGSVIEPGPEPEVEYPASSIEEFSPEKLLSRAKRGHEDGDRLIRERGQELADMASRQKQRDRKQDLVARKIVPKTLTNILVEETEKTKATKGKPKLSSKQNLNQLPLGSGVGSGLFGNVPVVMDVGVPTARPEDAMIVQEMEDRYVDLDGGAIDVGQDPGAAALDPRVLLRQEEEESTQDLLADKGMVIHVDAEAGGINADIVDDRVKAGVAEPSQHNGDGADEDKLAIDTEDSVRGEPKPTSLDQTERKSPPEFVLPPMASTVDPFPKLRGPPRSQTYPPTKYHSTSNTQSVEISRLEQALEDERVKGDAIAKEIISLKDALAQASASNAANLQQQLTEVRDQQSKDVMTWAAERSALMSSLDSLKQAKLSAESDRDFFREQYGQASGYVSSVRMENEELESRATIAEKQAKDGVNMIRNTFQGRIKLLEDELRQCKGLVMLLTEKDKRTGDEIRRKAGEEPELRTRCSKLEKMAEKLTEENATLATKLDEAQKGKEALEQEMQEWREDLARVDVEVRAYKTKMERLFTSSASEGEDDLAYRCEWRLDKNMPCESIFADTTGLRDHLLEHIHR